MTKLPKKYVSNKSWDRYKLIIQNFLDDDAGRQTITWAKHVNQILTHGEDYTPHYYNLTIEALCYYNAFRNWPINKASTTGQLDDENLSIMVSHRYLLDNHYLNDEGYWDFNWVEDRFIINGITYMPCGDTQVSQAKDQALVSLLILKRDRDTKITFIT